MAKATAEFGDRQVTATIDGKQVVSDLAKEYGGDGINPRPFQYLLSSLLNCSALGIAGYCKRNELSTDNISLSIEAIEKEDKSFSDICYQLTLPSDLSDKDKKALRNVVAGCRIKRIIENPPRFSINVCEQ